MQVEISEIFVVLIADDYSEKLQLDRILERVREKGLHYKLATSPNGCYWDELTIMFPTSSQVHYDRAEKPGG